MMNDIIDLTAQREKKKGNEVYTDRHGINWYPFSYKYKLEGKDFSLTVWAISENQAKGNLLKALHKIELEGRIYVEGEITPPMFNGAIVEPSVTWTDDE